MRKHPLTFGRKRPPVRVNLEDRLITGVAILGITICLLTALTIHGAAFIGAVACAALLIKED
jgi:hypothetical protein